MAEPPESLAAPNAPTVVWATMQVTVIYLRCSAAILLHARMTRFLCATFRSGRLSIAGAVAPPAALWPDTPTFKLTGRVPMRGAHNDFHGAQDRGS